MDRRRIMIAGGAVVATAAIVLVLQLRSRTDAASSATPAPSSPIPDRTTERAPSLDRPSHDDTPSVPETITGSARIRDHREGDQVAYEGRGSAGRTQTRLPATLVQAISTQLEAAMRECTATIPASARGERPRVSGSILVDVAAGTLTVTEASISLTDLTSDAAGACMQAAWVGLTAAAPDAVSASHYEISVLFAVPSH